MSAQRSLYQTLLTHFACCAAQFNVPAYSLARLALLVCGILAAKSTTLSRIAAELDALGLTNAADEQSIQRRLRRTLNDSNLTAATCYAPLLVRVLDWSQLLADKRQVVIAIDESSRGEQIHLLRAALCYWGGSLPLAWVCWEQNQAQAQGHYWQQIDSLFIQLAALLPADVAVVIVADRAYGVSNFVDRCLQLGWHFVLRLTTSGSHRYVDEQQEEQSLREVIAQQLAGPGQRWLSSGKVFKKAGWRQVELIGVWREGEKEPLVVLSDQALGWVALDYYKKRFWIESGFRNDKSYGWRWEQSQVQGVVHHERLLLAMALASLVSLCLGVEQAQQKLVAEEARRVAGKQSKARGAQQSIFRQGLGEIQRWLYGRGSGINWRLSGLAAASWQQQWLLAQQLIPPAVTLQQAV